jgi:tetratricopeptide (TPR) repeat protein
VLQAIGDVQQFRKETNAALESYAKALDLFKAVGDRLGEANVLKAIGDVQQFRKETNAALESYAKALDLFKAVGDRLGEANVYLAIGRLQGEPELFEQAIAIYRAIGDAYSTARGLYFYGLWLLDANQLERAVESLSEARQIWAQMGFAQGVQLAEQALASAWNTLGSARDEAGDKPGALAAFECAIALQPDFAMWHRNRAGVLIELGRLDEAAAAIETARRLEPDAPRLKELDEQLAAARAAAGKAC